MILRVSLVDWLWFNLCKVWSVYTPAALYIYTPSMTTFLRIGVFVPPRNAPGTWGWFHLKKTWAEHVKSCEGWNSQQIHHGFVVFICPKDPYAFVYPKNPGLTRSNPMTWGWDWGHQSYSREGSGFLGLFNVENLLDGWKKIGFKMEFDRDSIGHLREVGIKQHNGMKPTDMLPCHT